MTREEANLTIDYLKEMKKSYIEGKGYGRHPLPEWYALDKAIEAIEQKPKTGHWIMPAQDDGMSDPIYYQVRCSKCGFDLDPQTWGMELHQYGADKYCPKCGAKMAESEEK